MISVDTNVLLRRILNDDEAQSAKARKLFEGTQTVLITDIVLVETIWTLTGKRYGASRDDIAMLVTSLLEEANIVFENRQAVWSALNEYIAAPSVKTANGSKTADLPAALIINKARQFAHDRKQTYGGTYTFDLAALQIAGAKAP